MTGSYPTRMTVPVPVATFAGTEPARTSPATPWRPAFS
jgi:hypothetical protein